MKKLHDSSSDENCNFRQLITNCCSLANTLALFLLNNCAFRREAKIDDDCLCPPKDKIPAISAVIYDPGLFRALLRCLQTATGIDACVLETATGATGLSVASGGNHHLAGRKRSLSMTTDTSVGGISKSMKIGHHHSPIPTSRKMSMNTNMGMERKPVFNLPVLAATILYTAFQHLDHWPVPLVKAYAEDCFGPRLWVDAEQCALLTENLALSHRSPTSGDESTEMQYTR